MIMQVEPEMTVQSIFNYAFAMFVTNMKEAAQKLARGSVSSHLKC